MEMKLAKGGQLRDQEWRVHASTTSQIARVIADLKHLDEMHKKLLEYCSYWHDIGKEVLNTYKGKHKLAFETCFKELKKELYEIDENNLKVIVHLILRHHYTSKKDIEELTKIYVPPAINIDLILRNLRASDWLASKDRVNLAELDRIINQIKPLGFFAYTISREGVLAGKMMDIVDEILIKKGGKGIYFHNGSIFFFEEDIRLNLSELKKEIKNKAKNFLLKIFKRVIGIRGNPRGIVISPISELNTTTWKESEIWERILDRFHTKLSRAKDEKGRQNAYLFVQKAISEIFSYFNDIYSLEAPSLKFHPVKEVIKPILPDIRSKLKNPDLHFNELDYDDFKIIGEEIYNYIEKRGKNKPEFGKENLVDKATTNLLNSMTFLGDRPEGVQKICSDWHENYLKTAKEKGIGKENQEEFCFICGAPTTFSFKAAVAQKIKISKIFSNRRPALAKGIDTVKICPLCLAEMKFLDDKLPGDASTTVFLYIERPVTIKPPYVEIKERFLNQLGSLKNKPYYAEEFENIRYAENLFFEESQARWSIGTNHFYVIFGDSPGKLGPQETMLYLLPFLYSFIKQTGFSIRVNVANNMDYKPVYRLLEIPPLAEEFTASDFKEPNGRFYKDYVLPVSIWLKLKMGNIIDFVKKFPREWSHFFARALQDERYKRFRKYLRDVYPSIKGVYG